MSKTTKVFGALMLLIAFMGTSMAIDNVEFVTPVDDQKFKMGEEVTVDIIYKDFDGNCKMTSRLLVNGEPILSDFVPSEKGFYDLTVEVTDSYDGSFVTDTVTIHVIGNNKSDVKSNNGKFSEEE